MPTKREYLVSKGLAKPGRGRFSREAVAALERARQDGTVFDDEDGSAGPEEGPAPTPYIPPRIRDYPIKRDIKRVIGYTSGGSKVSSDICFKCSLHVKRCACTGGITASPIVARWDEESEPYGRPIDIPVLV